MFKESGQPPSASDDRPAGDSTADAITDYAASLTYSDLSELGLHAVKRSLIDSIGCALGAYAAEPVRIARTLASRITSETPASIFGSSLRTSPEMATFVNGSMVRYLDYNDDYLNNDGPHPSDNIAAVMAGCEVANGTGKDLVCGIALAYEIVGQLVDSAEFNPRGWDYVTETSIGSALGSGKMLGLSRDQLSHALALSIAPNITLNQTRTGELSMWKGCAGANAARNGLFATLLAAEGMTGPYRIIEGPKGLWSQVTGPFKLGAFGNDTHPFKVERTFFKPRPICYNALLAVEIALELRQQVDVEEIQAIEIVLDRFSVMTSNTLEKWDPHTRETADHSIPYLVVVALLDGAISETSFVVERYRDPQVLALLKRVTLSEDRAYTDDWPDPFNCRIDVVQKGGRVISKHSTNPRGHPSNPMTDGEIEQKFRALTRDCLTREQADHALELLWRIEEVDHMSVVFDAFAKAYS